MGSKVGKEAAKEFKKVSNSWKPKADQFGRQLEQLSTIVSKNGEEFSKKIDCLMDDLNSVGNGVNDKLDVSIASIEKLAVTVDVRSKEMTQAINGTNEAILKHAESMSRIGDGLKWCAIAWMVISLYKSYNDYQRDRDTDNDDEKNH